ncbi:Indole-3-glycerol phosphate synthase [compost metagenome]
MEARQLNAVPLLRKDFIIDEYQILEAKAWGADIILLIAAILTPKQIEHFGKMAQSLGLNVLLEVHDERELLQSICDPLNAIGVNNRNLGNFTVDLQTSFKLAEQIPSDFLKISESAIDNPLVISELKTVGYQGFLIGESFMRTTHPGTTMQEFVKQLL